MAQSFLAFLIANPMIPAVFGFCLFVLGWMILAAFETCDNSRSHRRRTARRRADVRRRSYSTR